MHLLLSYAQVYGEDTSKQMEAADAFLFKVLSLAYERQHHLGVLFVESFRSCYRNQKECDQQCLAHRQGFMTHNHTGANDGPASVSGST